MPAVGEERRELGIDPELFTDRVVPAPGLSRTCCVRISRLHSTGSSFSIAPGTISLITRAPWLPPTTSSRSGPFGSDNKRHPGSREDRRAHRRADGGRHAGERDRDRAARLLGRDPALAGKATTVGTPMRPAILAAAAVPYASPEPNGPLRCWWSAAARARG